MSVGQGVGDRSPEHRRPRRAVAEHHRRTVAGTAPRDLSSLPLVALGQVHVHKTDNYAVVLQGFNDRLCLNGNYLLPAGVLEHAESFVFGESAPDAIRLPKPQ